MTNDKLRGLQLRSLATADGRLELSLQESAIDEPKSDEVVVRVEAAPIHPSDIGLLLGPVDLASLEMEGSADRSITSGKILPERLPMLTPRMGLSMPVGNEGAGTVIKAGSDASALLGNRVALAAGAMYSQYRLVSADQCLVLPDDVSSVEGAAAYVNPLTALSLTDTMRLDGHKALVHTAAASTLGQMLVRICQSDGIPLVNIVRSAEQVTLLRNIGAQYVIDSTSPDFMAELTDAIAATGATVAFDAVGGGPLASQILAAMEAVLSRDAAYSRYGSTTHKQIYIYGGLDIRPITIDRAAAGMYWGVDSFMLGMFLEKVGLEGRRRLETRIAAELKTTFATSYTATISLAEALLPDNLARIARRATGEKFLITP